MKIKILKNDEGYITSYAVSGNLIGSIETEVPNDLINRYETFATIWNGNSFVQGNIVSTKEELKAEFLSDYKYYKFDNGNLIFDENKKIEEERLKLEARKDELRQQIKQIDSDIAYYKTQNWDVTNLESKKQKLLEELNSL